MTLSTWSLFAGNTAANVATTFGLCLPVIALLAALSVDYSTAIDNKTELQAAIDAAVLSGVQKNDPNDRNAVATSTLSSHKVTNHGAPLSSAFTTNGDGTFSGTAYTQSPTPLAGGFGFPAITVSAQATARIVQDNSCLLTLGNGSSVGTASFTLNGAPDMNLAGCSVNSNTSMSCNGHGGGATSSIAVGTAAGCSNPVQGAAPLPDIYRSLQGNIALKCQGFVSAATWSPSAGFNGSQILTYTSGPYTEVHVCGTLTLSGAGALNTTGGDLALVIENGSLVLSGSANVASDRTTLVFTGSNSSPHAITFPGGKGNGATLTLNPPSSSTSPWRGISIFYDPALTSGVDVDIGPGGSLVFDGVIYMPNSNLTFHGNTSSGAIGCSKLIVNTFTTSGSGSLSFSRNSNACATAGVNQFSRVSLVH